MHRRAIPAIRACRQQSRRIGPLEARRPGGRSRPALLINRLDRIPRSGAARLSRRVVRRRSAARAACTPRRRRLCPSAPGSHECLPRRSSKRPRAAACSPGRALEGSDAGSAGVFLFRRGTQSDRGLRTGAGIRGHAGCDRQAPQVRHELRLLRRRDPGDHRGGCARRVAEMGTFLICQHRARAQSRRVPFC